MSRDGIIANQIKNEERKYELPLAPIKRLLQRGSDSNGVQIPEVSEHPHKMTEAALLEYRQQVEKYALNLAQAIGNTTRSNKRKTIQHRDVIQAVNGRGS